MGTNKLRFDGRTLIVTGAGGGMGRAHATLLARRGANVVVNDISNAEHVVGTIVAAGGMAVASTADISTPDGAAAVVHEALDRYSRLDGIVNNAGISVHRPFTQVTPELARRTIDVNTLGAFYVTQAAWPHLVRSGAGRVVMIASTAAITGSPNLAHYAMSKGGLLGLCRQLAAEGAADGIAVNAVAPYAVTPMSTQLDGVADAARMGVLRSIADDLGVDHADVNALARRTTDLVAPVVAWLCHPECASTGELFLTKGGEVRRIAYVETVGITDRDLTIETVRDRFAEILDVTGAKVRPSMRGSLEGAPRSPHAPSNNHNC